MKARLHFVSNSSSSSFIVAFPKKPENAKDVKEILFGRSEEYTNPYPDENSPHYYPADEVANTVWADILGQESLDEKELLEIISRGHFPDIPDYEDFGTTWKEIDWDKYGLAVKMATAKYLDTFLKDNKDKPIYTFEYSDNGGEYYCALEHGDLFEALPHLKISNH